MFKRVFRRNLVHTGIPKPDGVEVLQHTSKSKPARHASASIKNGIVNQRAFPRGTLMPTLLREVPGVVGWAASFGAILFLWPYLAVKLSEIWNSVPPQTPQVVLVGKKAIVNIPTKEVHLDKPSDDE